MKDLKDLAKRQRLILEDPQRARLLTMLGEITNMQKVQHRAFPNGRIETEILWTQEAKKQRDLIIESIKAIEQAILNSPTLGFPL